MERDLSEYLDKVDAIHSQVEELIMQANTAYDEGYEKAVDEFLNKCKEMVEKTKIARLELFEICEMAEELKTARGSE
jgi:hypothetical protein